MKGLQIEGLPFKVESTYLLRVIKDARGNIRLAEEMLEQTTKPVFWMMVIEQEQATIKWATRWLTQLKRELRRTYGE